MAKGLKAAKAIRARGVTVLAWTSLAVAVAGGALAVDTWVGHTVTWVLGLFPWGWIPPVLLAAGVIATGLDLFMDGVPNQVAVGSVLVMPSIAAATPGKLGDKVTEWSGALLRAIDGDLSGWIGTNSSTGLAIGCVVVALLLARRVVKKSKSTVVA